MITKSWYVGWEYCKFYVTALIVEDVYTNTYLKVMAQDGEHMYTCGGFILILGKTNTIM